MKFSDIRIIHITNNLEYGGVQKIIFQLCKGTKDFFDKVIVASTGGVYVDRLNEIGIEHFNIPDISSKNPIDIVKIYQILNLLIDKYNINVIHCHHRMAVLFAKFFSKKVRIIYNNHTIYSDKPLLTHRLLKDTAIIADGVQAKRNVTDFFRIKDENVIVINNAVDSYDGEYHVVPEIENARNNGFFIVLNSSRFHPQKGLGYFIAAANIIIKKGYNIKFFLVGDGSQKDEIINRINQLGINDNIVLLGFRKDIKNVISQCDVLVLTSVYEGLPLTPMEAFSVKKPVIATDIDGSREVVEDGYNGLLAVSKDPESIAGKIEELYLNRYRLNELSQNAYRSFINKFSEEPFIENYMKFYASL